MASCVHRFENMTHTHPVDLIVPVFNGLAHVRRCLESVLAHSQQTPHELIVVDDASTDAETQHYLDHLAQGGRITLIRNAENIGFVGSVNRGMTIHPERDVVLLNSDTEAANDWLDRLRHAVYASDATGTATPFSNNATICSYPEMLADNRMPPGLSLAELDAVFATANAGNVIDIPTAVGFCMYIRRQCLDQVGLFDADLFGRGYGEENDFCLRAEALGWKHVLCADVFVYHHGSATFAGERAARVNAAIALLNAKYPDYTEKIQSFIARDPAAPARRSIDIALARRGRTGNANTRGGWARLHVLHDYGGGIEHWLNDFCQADEAGRNLALKPFSVGDAPCEGVMLFDIAQGWAPIRIWHFQSPFHATAISHDEYRIALETILQEYSIGAILVSSLIGHSLDVLDTDTPTALIAHDYYPLCPAINLHFGTVCAHCDEPRLTECTERNADFNAPDLMTPVSERSACRTRYQALIQHRNIPIVTPTHATRRHLLNLAPDLDTARFVTLPHGAGQWLEALPESTFDHGPRRLRLVMLGMMSVSKGSRLLDAMLVELASFADVYLVGTRELGDIYQHKDGIHIIESYRPEDLHRLVADIAPDVGLLLSIWPETFSYTLSELMMLGIPPVATNLGAFAERIRHGHTGYLCEPTPDALLTCLRDIDAHRQALVRIRQNLRSLPRHASRAMVDDYRALLPTELRPNPPTALPGIDPVAAEVQAKILNSKHIKSLELSLDINRHARWQVEVDHRRIAGTARIEIEAARHEAEVLHNQLHTMHIQLQEHQAELARAASSINALNQSLAERETSIQELTQSNQALDQRNIEFVQRINDLQRNVNALTKHAQGLRIQLDNREAEVREIVTSTSWRITHPMRWLGNNLRRVRRVAQFAWPVLREPRIWRVTFSKLYVAWRIGGLPALKQKLSRPPEDAQFQGEWLEYRRALAEDVTPRLAERLQGMTERPLISILLPTYNTPEGLLREAIESVRQQIYPDWELCIADDASPKAHVQNVLKEYAGKDSRIRLHLARTNKGVSYASNRALEMAQGVFCVLLDHDDALEPQALLRLAETIAADRPDFVYSDEALVSLDGQTLKFLAFRPAFSREYLRAHPFIVHMAAARTELMRAIGGFDESLRISQDYDLFLRLTERAERIVHIPEILYLWRIHDTSSGHDKMLQVMATSRDVLTRHLQRMGEAGWVEDGPSFNFFSSRYPLKPGLRVAIVIPTKNHGDLVRQCIDSIRATVREVEYDIVIIDHESTDAPTLDYFASLQAPIRVLRYAGPFNFSAINNWAIAQLPEATYSHYLLCNNDIEAIHEGWLERMLELGQKDDVGIVGAKLFYPDRKTIQHAGVCVGGFGAAEHYAKQMVVGDPRVDLGYFGRLSVNQEQSAVTAACLLIRRDTFEELAGFDEAIAVGFGDVDLCLRALQHGWRILYCPYAALVHHESYTRGTSFVDPHPEDSAYFMDKWRDFLNAGDPYFNPNLDTWNMAWAYKRPLTPRLDVSRRLWSGQPGKHRQHLKLVVPQGGRSVELG